jgi:hypothetical protein
MIALKQLPGFPLANSVLVEHVDFNSVVTFFRPLDSSEIACSTTLFVKKILTCFWDKPMLSPSTSHAKKGNGSNL